MNEYLLPVIPAPKYLPPYLSADSLMTIMAFARKRLDGLHSGLYVPSAASSSNACGCNAWEWD
jgi:hypothetical protein